MKTKAKIREFLGLAKEIAKDCMEEKIECYECPLKDGGLCSAHSSLVREITKLEEEAEEEYLEDDITEVLEEVVEKIGLIKKTYGSDLSVIIEEDTMKKSKHKKITTYLFLDRYENPVAIFGIVFNQEDGSIEVLETEDLGGRM